jgi:hypothetical protein
VERAELRSPEVSEQIPPTSEPTPHPLQIEAQPLALNGIATSVPEKTTPSPSLAADSEVGSVAKTGRREAPSPGPGHEEDRVPQPATPRAPLGSTAESQGTSRDDAGKLMPADTANSESDRKAPRIQIAEKALQTQTAAPSSGQESTGVWLNRVSEPAGPPRTHFQTSASETAQPSTAPPELETASAVPPQPIRQISLRLAADSANVDVQVVERAGKLQIAVRTPDQELATSLQTNLGELVGRLEQKGFRTEAWAPVTAQHGTGAVKEPSNTANNQSQSDDSGFRGGQQGQQRRQQESNQRQPGRWKTQLQETLPVPFGPTQEEEQS